MKLSKTKLLNIVKVYVPKRISDYGVRLLKKSEVEVLYEREEKYEYTQQEN